MLNNGEKVFVVAEQSAEWEEDRVDVTPNEQTEAFLIVAEYGDGPDGNIAIDDITLVYGTCSATETTTASMMGKPNSHVLSSL